MTFPQERYSGTVNTVREGSFLPGTQNTVEEGNPANLSFPNTHPSFLGTEGPLTSGSLVPPVQPQEKERSLYWTNSSQRRQWRDLRRCARNTPNKKHPHFLPIQRRCCRPYLHMSPTSGEEPLLDRRAFSSAIMCKPIKARAFLLFRLGCRARVRSTHQGRPSALSSERTGTFQCVETVRIHTLSYGSKMGPNTFPHRCVPHL